jgi:hypothetical protein
MVEYLRDQWEPGAHGWQQKWADENGLTSKYAAQAKRRIKVFTEPHVFGE